MGFRLEGIVSKLPPSLHLLALTIYWRIHPSRDNVTLIPKGDLIHIIKGDVELIYPMELRFLLPRIQKPYPVYKEFCGLEKGGIVVDAGADIERDTLLMVREVGESGRVIAVEPVPSNVDWLKRNLELNNMENVDVVERGLWSERGSFEIFIADFLEDHSMFEELPHEVKGRVKIRTDKLDNILSELGLEDERIGLLKMNIEGAEVEALKGSKKTLAGTEKVLVQTHRRGGFDTTSEVCRILKSEGFEIFGRKKVFDDVWMFFHNHQKLVCK